MAKTPTRNVKMCPSCGEREINTRSKVCAQCYGRNKPEDRAKHALCGAKKRDDTPCKNYAGQRTEHPGVGTCWLHLGRSVDHGTHAVAVEARRRMVTMGEPVEHLTAPEALMSLLRGTAGAVEWIRGEVSQLDGVSSHESRVLVEMYAQERDRLARVAEACSRAGVDAALVRMEQTKVSAVVSALKKAADDIGLNGKQREAFNLAFQRRVMESVGQIDNARAPADRLATLRAEIDADHEQRVAARVEDRARELSGMKDAFPPDELIFDAEPVDPS